MSENSNTKEKRYYWLKLKRDFFKRHEIEVIEGMQNGKEYVLFYLKLLLESIDHNGMLRFSDTVPYDADMLASVTRTNIDTVKQALNIFYKLGLVELWDDQTLFMSGVQKMLGSETDAAERMRKMRQKQKSINAQQEPLGIPKNAEESHERNNVRGSYEDVQKCYLEKEYRDREKILDNNNPPIVPPTDEGKGCIKDDATAKGVVRDTAEGEKKKSKLDPAYDALFEEWWKAYPPRRRGSKQECRRKYEAAIKNNKGLTHEMMMSALNAQKQTWDWQKQNGQFVPAPLTWINQGRWEDEIYEPQMPPGKSGGGEYIITAEELEHSL